MTTNPAADKATVTDQIDGSSPALSPEQVRLADLETELAAANAHLLASVPENLRDLVPNTTVSERIAWINKAKSAGLFAAAVPATDNAKVRLTPGPDALAKLPAAARIAAGYQ